MKARNDLAAEKAKALKALEKTQAELDAIAARIRANPNADGWIRLCELLEQAAADPRVSASPGARDAANLMLETFSDALTTSTADEALRPLEEALASIKGKERGKLKGDPAARLWIQAEWEQRKDDYDHNKSAFARDYAQKLHTERRLKNWRISPSEQEIDTLERKIREEWLKKK